MVCQVMQWLLFCLCCLYLCWCGWFHVLADAELWLPLWVVWAELMFHPAQWSAHIPLAETITHLAAILPSAHQEQVVLARQTVADHSHQEHAVAHFLHLPAQALLVVHHAVVALAAAVVAALSVPVEAAEVAASENNKYKKTELLLRFLLAIIFRLHSGVGFRPLHCPVLPAYLWKKYHNLCQPDSQTHGLLHRPVYRPE